MRWYKNLDWIEIAFFLFLGFLGTGGIACLIFLGIGVVQEAAYKEQLMQDCIADGHKEYQCHAIIHGGDGNTGLMPMVIPVH